MTAIVSGGEDKKVMVWDTESKKCIQKYDCYESPITKTIFHPT
jgi:WD40 repeat protein